MLQQNLLLFFINVLSAIGYSLIAPLYPILARTRNVGDSLVGVIFSVFAISNLVAIPLTPRLINLVGRRRLFYYSIIIEAICTLMFALVSQIHNRFLFISVSLMARFCQGIGSALSSTLVYSIAATLSKEDNIKVTMGYMELAYSIGLTLGPLVASFLFYLNGYYFPFFVCGLLELLCIPFISKLEIMEQDYEEPQFFHIMFNSKILFTMGAIIIDMAAGTFIYPVFSHHLFNKFGLSVEVSSIFFVISMGTYFLMIQFLDKVSTRLGVKLTIFIGLSVNFLAVPLLSPVSLLPQTLSIVIFGLIVLGITGAMVTVPGIIDFMETMKLDMKMDETVSNDVSSALYNLSINMGEALGPLIGGYFTQTYSFDVACYFTSSICLIYAVAFLFFNHVSIKKTLHEKAISKHIINESEVNRNFEALIFNDFDARSEKSNKNIIQRDKRESVSYAVRHRAYSFSSRSSRHS